MPAANASCPIEPLEFPTRTELPFYDVTTCAGRPTGFQSPAQDYTQRTLDLNEHLIQRPSATFFTRVSGDSMTGCGIHDGDLLVVDRSLTATDRKIVYVLLDGEFFVKRFRQKGGRVFLESENPKFKAVEITEEMQFEIWGVVTSVIHQL